MITTTLRGMQAVFGDGAVDNVCDLLYPHDQPGRDIPEFTCHGVRGHSTPGIEHVMTRQCLESFHAEHSA